MRTAPEPVSVSEELEETGEFLRAYAASLGVSLDAAVRILLRNTTKQGDIMNRTITAPAMAVLAYGGVALGIALGILIAILVNASA